MNLDQINRWLTLAANLGVLAGFVLLAVQLRQNTDAIKLQHAYDLNGGVIATEMAAMGDSGYAAHIIWDHYKTAFAPSYIDEIDRALALHKGEVTNTFRGMLNDLHKLDGSPGP